jgi:small-conductance mechanosensitive channel
MLIAATQDAKKAEEDDSSKKQLQYRVKQLEGELEERDADFEKRLRSLRQEQERMRAVYENRAANPHEAKKVNELEDELQKTKTYYHKRIRELEDKYKFNAGKDIKKTVGETKLKASPIEDRKTAGRNGQQIVEMNTEEDAVKVKEQFIKLTQLRE